MGMTPQYFHTIPTSCAILSTTYALCGIYIYHFVVAEGGSSMFHKSYWMATLLSNLNEIICAYHGHTLLLHTGGQESIQSHTSRKYLCNSE